MYSPFLSLSQEKETQNRRHVQQLPSDFAFADLPSLRQADRLILLSKLAIVLVSTCLWQITITLWNVYDACIGTCFCLSHTWSRIFSQLRKTNVALESTELPSPSEKQPSPPLNYGLVHITLIFYSLVCLSHVCHLSHITSYRSRDWLSTENLLQVW